MRRGQINARHDYADEERIALKPLDARLSRLLENSQRENRELAARDLLLGTWPSLRRFR